MLDEQHAQTLQATLQAQEAFVQQINAPIVVFTANIERFLNAIQPPPPPRRSPASTPERETLLSPSQRPTPSFTEEAEDIPVHPYRSHPPPRLTPQTAPRPLPVREMTAFTTTTGEQPANHSGVKIPKFYGKDSENVLAWLHIVDHYFLLNRTPDIEKVATVHFSLKGGARNFAHVLVVENKGIDPPWDNFRNAFIRKYENAAMRADLLRDKLKAIRYHGPHQMTEFCEKFREIESQIYDMAFPDRVNSFVDKLYPPEAAMHIKNVDSLRSKEMEVVYQLARQWANNARLSRPGNYGSGHSGSPRHGKILVRFGSDKKKPRPRQQQQRRLKILIQIRKNSMSSSPRS